MLERCTLEVTVRITCCDVEIIQDLAFFDQYDPVKDKQQLLDYDSSSRRSAYHFLRSATPEKADFSTRHRFDLRPESIITEWRTRLQRRPLQLYFLNARRCVEKPPVGRLAIFR